MCIHIYAQSQGSREVGEGVMRDQEGCARANCMLQQRAASSKESECAFALQGESPCPALMSHSPAHAAHIYTHLLNRTRPCDTPET